MGDRQWIWGDSSTLIKLPVISIAHICISVTLLKSAGWMNQMVRQLSISQAVLAKNMNGLNAWI